MATGPQEQAYTFVFSQAPAGALVVASPAYVWTLEQGRQDLLPMSWFDVSPGIVGRAQHILLVVDSHFMVDMANLPVIHGLYDKSILAAAFGAGFGRVEVRVVR